MTLPKHGKKKHGRSSDSSREEQQFLGRWEKNNCRIGIVGLPNIGKSSLFNVLSKQQVPAENYPFCTIKPSQAQVPVPDKRFVHLCHSFKPKSEVSAVLHVWDIAGLVKGAHEGNGLGNEFLSNIQAVDAIFHVVRAFRDSKVEHVEGSLNPVRDMQIVTNELRMKDLIQLIKKRDVLLKLTARSKNKQQIQELQIVHELIEVLESGEDVQSKRWPNKYLDVIRGYNLFSAKPVVYLVNVSESNWLKGSNKYMEDIQIWVKEHYPYSAVIPFSAKFEKNLSEMDAETAENYLGEHSTKSALNKIIHHGYKALSLIHFFTCGEDEVRAWTLRKGSKAPQAGGVIHSDMQIGFICCETYSYKSFRKYKSEHECKAHGKYLQNGRNYVIQDGDVLFFKFNKPVQKKNKKNKNGK